MQGKKAESISINVIIIAIIALLVLVVLMAIFGNQMGLWGKNIKDVQSQYCEKNIVNGEFGKVIPADSDCGDGFTESFGAYKDVSAGVKCCLPVRQ